MNREKTQELIDQREEQRADIFVVTMQDEESFIINRHPYKLITDHKQGFVPEKLGQRFSSILSKYDYIVGDWGFDQLRLKGFYKNDNPNMVRSLSVDHIQDYLYEQCNFGCAYFIVQNLDVKVQRPRKKRKSSESPKNNKQKHQSPKNQQTSSSKRPAKSSNRSRKNRPYIKERVEEKNRPLKERKNQTAKTVGEQTNRNKFVIRQKS